MGGIGVAPMGQKTIGYRILQTGSACGTITNKAIFKL
jgi:hypothetical protein